MKILQVLHGENYSGMEKACIDLTNELAIRNNKIYFMGSVAFKDKLDKKVNFIEINIKKSRNNIFFLFSILREVKKISPDIVHLHKQKSIQIFNRINSFLNIPLIATKHDTQNKKAFLGLKYCITISDDVTKTIKADNIYKIYNGIEYKEPRNIDMPKDRFNIVAIGGLRKVKGYDNLIKSCSNLSFDYHLTIIGEGEERKNLEALISSLKLENRVSLIGFKSNINDFLFSSDLQVISSLSEGFSLAMIEGVFYSKVLISTPVSGCTEILSDKLVVEEKSLDLKINSIYKDYGFYKEEFKKIKVFKDKFTIENCAKKHIKVYKTIIKK